MKPIFYGWIVAGCAFSILFVTYGVQYSFGVFVAAMVAELGWPRASLGAAFSLYGVVYMSFTMFSGYITERFGPRRVITAGGLLLGIGIMGSSFVTAAWQLLLTYGVVAGIGMSTAYIPCNMTVVRWFMRRRGLAVGLSSCGASCGVLVIPMLVLFLIEYSNWRGLCLVIRRSLACCPTVRQSMRLRIPLNRIRPRTTGRLPKRDVPPRFGYS